MIRPAAIIATLLIVASGCSAAQQSAAAGGGNSASACDEAFAAAASVDDMHDTVSDLYPAVRECLNVDAWVAAADANPGAIAVGVNPLTFLGNVCGDPESGLEGAPLCQQVADLCDSNDAVAMTMVCPPE